MGNEAGVVCLSCSPLGTGPAGLLGVAHRRQRPGNGKGTADIPDLVAARLVPGIQLRQLVLHGRIEIGAGYEEIDDEVSGLNTDDTRAYLSWTSPDPIWPGSTNNVDMNQ